MILGSEGSQFKYMNASLNQRECTNHKVTELRKREVVNPTPQLEAAAGKVAKKSVENIVNGQEIVLHMKNAAYKRIMFDQFQVMSGKKIKREELAQNALKLLKKAALENNNLHMKDFEGEGSTSHYLFRCDQHWRSIYPVSDEEALKSKLRSACPM